MTGDFKQNLLDAPCLGGVRNVGCLFQFVQPGNTPNHRGKAADCMPPRLLICWVPDTLSHPHMQQHLSGGCPCMIGDLYSASECADQLAGLN